MYTLGIHGGTNTINGFGGATPGNWLHDASAVLCYNGRVVAASEEERFVRIKHVNYFPLEAIRFCLRSEGIGLQDVERVVLTSAHMDNFLNVLNNWRYGTSATAYHCSFKEFSARLLRNEFGQDVMAKMLCAGHHRSHALSTVYHSGYSECLCIVMDAWGDGLTGVVSLFKNGDFQKLVDFSSTGPAALYLMGTHILGFAQFDEYKVMGLAPYGDPAPYIDGLFDMIRLEDEGRFTITIPPGAYQAFNLHRERGAPLLQKHKDFAAALQTVVERVIMHVAAHFRKQSGAQRLCLAGGFAQNCTANGKLLASRLFSDVFVQPASYDAGCAIGAAFHGFLESGGRMPIERIKHAYWGGGAFSGAEEPEQRLKDWKSVMDVEYHQDISLVAAQLISRGQVIGWVQGRSEFGARALGNRSILADPRPSDNKDRINAMIKKREGFRPFAPSVLEENLHEYFEVDPSTTELPFMVFVVKVREQYRKVLGAVTHVDGTARVQTVSIEANPQYHGLIKAFGNLTGIPIVLNTSFNNNHEPIVNTYVEAINCYLSTDLDCLVIGNYLFKKRSGLSRSEVLLPLIPKMHHRYALERHIVADGSLGHFLRDRHSDNRGAISPAVYECLTKAAESRVTFGEILKDAGNNTALALESLYDLWCRRVFHCDVR